MEQDARDELVRWINEKLDAAEADIAAGRVLDWDFEALKQEIRKRAGRHSTNTDS